MLQDTFERVLPGARKSTKRHILRCALDNHKAVMWPEIERANSPKTVIEMLVHSYMDWVTRQPELARFMFLARSGVAAINDGEERAVAVAQGTIT